MLLLLLIEVAQLDERVRVGRAAAMRAEIEVRAVGDALELAPAHGELVLEVDAALGVVRELVARLLALLEVLGAQAEVRVPLRARVDPHLVRGLVLAWLDEVLDLHLLELLPRAEREVAGRDLVAESFADLRDAEGKLAAHGVEHVLKVHEDALRRLGPQVGQPRVVARVHGAHGRLEHQVERPGLREIGRAAARFHELLGGDAGGVDLSPRDADPRPFCAAGDVVRRVSTPLQLRQSVIGSENVASWPENRHTSRFMRMAASKFLHVVALGDILLLRRQQALDVVLEPDAWRAVVPGASRSPP